MLDIYKLVYFIWPVWSLQQDWKISNEGPFFRFSWDCWLTLPRWKSLCHSLARDQPQPGSFFQRPKEAEKRDPGNEVVVKSVHHFGKCRANQVNRARVFIGWQLPTHVCESFTRQIEFTNTKKLVKKLARIEASSICRQQFANVFADCFCAIHTHQLEFAHTSLPTSVCRMKAA